MRYFIGPSPDSISSAIGINAVIFGDITKQRKNNNKTKIVVMLPEGDTEEHPSLSAFQEKTEVEMYQEMQLPEWQNDIAQEL